MGSRERENEESKPAVGYAKARDWTAWTRQQRLQLRLKKLKSAGRALNQLRETPNKQKPFAFFCPIIQRKGARERAGESGAGPVARPTDCRLGSELPSSASGSLGAPAQLEARSVPDGRLPSVAALASSTLAPPFPDAPRLFWAFGGPRRMELDAKRARPILGIDPLDRSFRMGRPVRRTAGTRRLRVDRLARPDRDSDCPNLGPIPSERAARRRAGPRIDRSIDPGILTDSRPNPTLY